MRLWARLAEPFTSAAKTVTSGIRSPSWPPRWSNSATTHLGASALELPRSPANEGLSYHVDVTAPLERPKTPASVVIVGSVVAVLIGFIILKMVIGFVITMAKLAIAVAVIVAVATFVSRALDND